MSGANWTAEDLAARGYSPAGKQLALPAVPQPSKGRRDQPEQELQIAIVDHWRPRLLPGARLFGTNGELPGGTIWFKKASARRKAMGYVRGTPDMCARRRGALLWLELKIPPNQPTPEQAAWAEWALSVGDGWSVVTSVGEAGVVLRAWGMVA